MPLTQPQQRELLRRYLTRQSTLTAAGATALAGAWRNLHSYDEADIARLRAAAEPAITEINARAAALTAGYLGLLLDEPVAAIDTFTEPDWRGPFTHYWGALHRGETQAFESGLARAEAAGEKAVVSTIRRAGDAVQSDQIVGWQRVLNGETCTWCVTVAQQTYHTAGSADFGHDRCNCGVTPILR